MECERLWLFFLFFICSGCALRAKTQHCYLCQSRGDRGDCKDPYNTTIAIKADHIRDCASGWCIKTTDVDASFPVTQRSCMPYPPENHVGRCTPATLYVEGTFSKKVYTCYCKGDLCNAFPLSNKIIEINDSAHFIEA